MYYIYIWILNFCHLTVTCNARVFVRSLGKTFLFTLREADEQRLILIVG